VQLPLRQIRDSVGRTLALSCTSHREITGPQASEIRSWSLNLVNIARCATREVSLLIIDNIEIIIAVSHNSLHPVHSLFPMMSVAHKPLWGTVRQGSGGWQGWGSKVSG